MENKKIMYVVVNTFDYQYCNRRDYYGSIYLTRKDANKYITTTNRDYTNIALLMFTYEIQPAGYIVVAKRLALEWRNERALKMTNAQIEEAKNTADKILRNTLVAIS